MLIPYGTVRRARRFPWVTCGIIALNALVHLCVTAAMQQANARGDLLWFKEFADEWGFRGDAPGRLHTLFTMMWIHDPLGGVLPLHILTNMWALLVFGPQVEDALGHVWYAVYYLAGGVFANLALWGMLSLAHVNQSLPTVGASGAVMAVLGMFAVRFYSTPVTSLFLFIPGVRLPAAVLLALYIGLADIRPGLLETFVNRSAAGVAHWAHIGGFMGGALVGCLTGVVRHARREYLVERPVRSAEERRERLRDLRRLVEGTRHDPEARLRLATLLDAESRTLPEAAKQYEAAIREFVLDGELARVCAAYDAYCEGGHGFGEISPEVSAAVGAAYEKRGRDRAALYVYQSLAVAEGAPARLTEQALVRVIGLARDASDARRAAWAYDRLRVEHPMSPWLDWAKERLEALGPAGEAADHAAALPGRGAADDGLPPAGVKTGRIESADDENGVRGE